MKEQLLKQLHRINYLLSETDALYHQASQKIGLSDSASMILYTIVDNNGSCLLSDIYKQAGISKQTVNSAIRKLESEHIVYLEKYSGREKKVLLTEAGTDFAGKTIAHLFTAEINAFSSWTEDEVKAYIHFLEKFISSFRAQVSQLPPK